MRFPALKIPFSWKDTFAALQHPNYRLWFFGQLISLVGSWMQSTAQGYLVYELTKDPFYLGLVGFAAGLPSWIFMLYGGVIADRIPRRTLLILTQSYMMILAFILAGLVFTGKVQPWHIVALALLLGIGNAFDAPARQAFVAELVPREDMTNAIALNSTMFNSATVVGPAVAGITYDLFGAAWCFTINGISFLAVIFALAAMRMPAFQRSLRRSSAASQVKEGMGFVLSHSLIRLLILNLGMVSLFGMSMMTLIPAWAVSVLGGDVRTNGLLLSARGGGALVGALLVAAMGRRKVQGKLWTIGSMLLPWMMLFFAATRWLPLSLAIMVGIGWAFMIQANTSNSLVQTRVPDEMRGRVMSIYTLIFFGGMPLGSLMVGALARLIGEPLTLALNAVMLFSFALFVYIRVPSMRTQG